MNTKLKTSLWILALPTTLLLLVGAVLFLLNQPAIGEKVFRRLADAVEGENLQFSYSTGELAVFKGFRFDDLRIQLREPGGYDLEVKIDRLEALYSLLEILGGHLSVDRLHVIRPRVSGKVWLKEEPSAAPASLPVWLNEVSLKDVQVKNAGLNLELFDGEVTNKFAINRTDAEGELLANIKDGLTLRGLLYAAVQGLHYNDSLLNSAALRLQTTPQKQAGETLIEMSAEVEKSPVAEASVQLSHADNLAGEFKAKLKVSPHILPPLQEIGALSLQMGGSFHFENTAQELLRIEEPDRWPLAIRLQGGVEQDREAASKTLFQVSPVEFSTEFSQDSRAARKGRISLTTARFVFDEHRAEEVRLSLEGEQQEEQWTARFESRLGALRSGLLPQAVALRGDGRASGDLDLAQLKVETDVQVNGLSLGRLKVSLQDKDGSLNLRPHAEVFLGRQWDFYLDRQLIAQIGQLNLELQGEVQVEHGRESWLAVEPETFTESPASLDLQGRFVQPSPIAGKAEFVLVEPADFSLKAEQNSQARTAILNVRLPAMKAQRMAEVRMMNLDINAKLPLAGGQGRVISLLSLEELNILKEVSGELPSDLVLSGFSLATQADLDAVGNFEISRFDGAFAQDVLALRAQGKGNWRQGDVTLNGDFALDTRGGFSAVPGLTAQGDIRFPWSFVMRKNRTVDIDGRMDLKKVTLRLGENFVNDMSGAIVLKESLVRRNGEWQLNEVLNRNPFERVDFHRFQPFLLETEPLIIQKVGFAGVEVGPMSGFFSLRQNLFTAQKFYFRIGRGEMAGEVFADFYPGQRAVGALLRVTDLRPVEIIPPKLLGERQATDQPLSGRVGLVYQMSQGTVDGRMDITEIGREQVLTMIDVLDPHLENENLNLARKGLAFGYPTGLFLGIQQGVLDLDLRLGGVAGALGKIEAPSVPISGVVSSISSELEKLIE